MNIDVLLDKGEHENRVAVLNRLTSLIYSDADRHELYEEVSRVPIAEARRRLIVRTMSECIEAYHAAENEISFAEQLADIAIMVHSVAGYCNVNLGEQVDKKRIINIYRRKRHEGEKR